MIVYDSIFNRVVFWKINNLLSMSNMSTVTSKKSLVSPNSFSKGYMTSKPSSFQKRSVSTNGKKSVQNNDDKVKKKGTNESGDNSNSESNSSSLSINKSSAKGSNPKTTPKGSIDDISEKKEDTNKETLDQLASKPILLKQTGLMKQRTIGSAIRPAPSPSKRPSSSPMTQINENKRDPVNRPGTGNSQKRPASPMSTVSMDSLH